MSSMWCPVSWETEDDVITDLLTLAEYCVPNPKHNEVPETIVQYKKQIAQNKQKPLNSDIDDSASYIISGRGRGISDRVIRPGEIVESHPSDEVELKKQIRQVAGFGYSNELIEQSIKAKEYKPEKNTSDSSFKLVPRSPSSSSTKSSNESSPAETNHQSKE